MCSKEYKSYFKELVSKIKLLFVFLLFFSVNHAFSQSNFNNKEFLISVIDLNFSGLEQVNKSSKNADVAVSELLRYYKQRNIVNHPVSRNSRSVTYKNIATQKDIETADNALKHVFVGQSAYPPFFCGDDIDWGTRPVPDNEWVWQLNRMSFWNAMAKVYWHTNDEKYAEAWAEQLIDWTKKNPNDEDHKYAWRSIEAGVRGHSWTGLYQRFIDSPNFTEDVLVAFLNSCHEHAEYLMTKYSTNSNWGLMEAEGMAFIAITFPEFKDSEKWLKEAFRRLNNEINKQVYPDGHQRELAMGYHLGCIDWFWRTYELAEMNGLEKSFPASYLKKIEKMCEVPMKLSLPDGTNVQFGDSWEGAPGQHNKSFQKWYDIFGRDDFLFLATDGKKGNKPDSTAYAFPYSGLYSMRSGWNENDICLVLKCGPDGGWHSHPDNGTFDLYAGGRNFMPDAGAYIYSGDPEGRAWFNQTKVHQTLTLDGKNIKYNPKLVKWQPGDSLDILVVENGSYEDLTHRRAVYFINKKYFLVVDEAFGNAIGDVAIHFQLAPDSNPVYYDSNVKTNFDNGWNLLIQTQPQPNLKFEQEEGWVSFKYTQKEPRPAFCYKIKKEKNDDRIYFVTLLIPYENISPETSVLSSKVEPDKLQIEVLINNERKTINYQMN